MNQDNLALHLSNISTIWTLLERAHTASRQEAKTAQEQLLERYAPQRFTDLLLDEIARSMENQTLDDLTQDVIDLGLLDYCQAALERRRGG
jgi:hypothetical protein